MSIMQEPVSLNGSVHVPTRPATGTTPARGTVVSAATAKFLAVMRVAIAVMRVAIGFVFLWAFLDKTFGFGYAIPSARAWIHGGSPTKGSSAVSRSARWSRPSTPGRERAGPTGCS
jgi:thiosulfate dehydrogenase [quinone] large subunit